MSIWLKTIIYDVDMIVDMKCRYDVDMIVDMKCRYDVDMKCRYDSKLSEWHFLVNFFTDVQSLNKNLTSFYSMIERYKCLYIHIHKYVCMYDINVCLQLNKNE